MERTPKDGTDDASIKPVSSLRSHFEGLKAPSKDDGPSSRLSPSTLRPSESPSPHPPARASFDLPRPLSPWSGSSHHGDLPRTPRAEKRRSQSPPKPGHRYAVSMLTGSSPILTPSVNVESPSSPPRRLFERSQSRSPERVDSSRFSKVKDLVSQHSSRTSSRPSTPNPESLVPTSESKPPNGLASRPPPVNRAEKPKIPAKSTTTISLAPPQNSGNNLGPEDNQRRPSFDAKISPFNTPPSSDESPSPVRSPPSAADISQSLKIASRQPQDASHPSQDLQRPIVAATHSSAKPSDSRALGFARTSTAPSRPDPRALGFSKPEPRPPSRDEHAPPARANTVSDRSIVRDSRELGLSSGARAQPRHVSENIRSSVVSPPSAPAQQGSKVSGGRDPRSLGFSGSTAVPASVAEEPGPDLPPRHMVKAPPPRPSEESKRAPPRPRQPSPGVMPDRSTKPGASTVQKALPPQIDAKFPAPPKRNAEDSARVDNPQAYASRARDGNDSDEAEGYIEAPAIMRNDYPDATQTNRRPPRYKASLPEVHVKTESRTFDVCGQYICTGGYTTRVFDMLSGEQLTGVNHGETVKATAVAFKPATDLQNEGTRIWIGTNAGDLQEMDVMTHSVVAQNTSHNRREIVQILRYQHELWTLDDEGKLFVWPADDSGVPNLRYSHISHRVQRGHTFSLVALDNLWLATGKEVRVYRPGNDASFTALTKPLTQAGSGDVTSGAFSEDKGGRVYFGHTDGKVNIYSATDYTCIGSVKASDYKINGLSIIGDDLWIGYKTGKIYVYDTRVTPWKVRKDWRAHDGPIFGLTLDGSSVWTMNRLQVTSIGHDGYARFWDGMLEDDWIEQAMSARDVQYCTFREVRTAVITWNAGAISPYDLRADFIADAFDPADPPEILVFGFQEVVDLEDRAVTAKSIFGFGKKKDLDSTEQHQSRVYREWRDYLSKIISRYTSARYAYSELHTSSLIGLFQCIFIRQDERPNARDTHAINVKCGMKGHYGNKGALVTRFVLDDSSLCFINCHLAAGQTQTSHRNNDIATILESENLPVERDPDARMSLYVGGGDGSQILDHEICVLNGDLNYRIDAIPRDTVINMIKRNEMSKLLERDQLLVSRRRVSGFRLSSFNELPLTFAPTYKYDVGTDNYDSSDKKRAPAWCDRILYRGPGRIKQVEYRRHEVKVSDHRPVSGIFKMRVKAIDSRKRAKVKDECYEEFKVVKKVLAEKFSQRYLVTELGVNRKEAKKLIVGS